MLIYYNILGDAPSAAGHVVVCIINTLCALTSGICIYICLLISRRHIPMSEISTNAYQIRHLQVDY
jgi:hypothetical protein